MDILFYLFGTAIFIAVVLMLEGAYLSWNARRGPEARRLERRLQAMSAGGHHGGDTDLSILKQRLLSNSPGLQQLLLRVPRVQSLDQLLVQSGVSMSVARFCGMTLACMVMGFVVSAFFPILLLFSLVTGLLCSVLPLLYVLRTRHKRLNRIEQQLPDAIDLMGRALRAGHAFPNAVKMVGDEMAEPIGSEFRILFDEVNYGIAMQDALLNLASRIPSMDLKYLVIAVLIQRETGGNLAELLDNVSGIIRARLKLLGTIRVLSAEGRMSAWVLGLLPFATAFVLQLVNPGFMSLLWADPAGNRMLYGVVVLMFFGMLWMRKIIRIHV
jgi:tight adherence protein B